MQKIKWTNTISQDDIWWNCKWMHKFSQLLPKWLFSYCCKFTYLQPFLPQSNTLVQQYLYSSTAQILGFQSDSIKVWLKSTFPCVVKLCIPEHHTYYNSMLQCRNAKPSVPEGQACSANQFDTNYNTHRNDTHFDPSWLWGCTPKTRKKRKCMAECSECCFRINMKAKTAFRGSLIVSQHHGTS